MPDDYSSNINTTGRITLGSSVTGTLETTDDHDWFRVSLIGGRDYTIDLEGYRTGAGTLSDPWLDIYNSNSVWIASDDDSGEGLNSRLIFTPDVSDDYFLSARSWAHNSSGTYTLSIITDEVEIFGGSGPDIIDETHTVDGQPLPSDGTDIIYGMSGRDTIDGLGGADEIYGGSNNDELMGSWGNDILSGDSGKDTLYGGDGNDTLKGGSGHDILNGGAGDDFLDGGSGHDILEGGEGADELTGGSAKDTFIFSDADLIDMDDFMGDNGLNYDAIDTIIDFDRDYIDVTAIDADSNPDNGNQALYWLGNLNEPVENEMAVARNRIPGGIGWGEFEGDTFIQAVVYGGEEIIEDNMVVIRLMGTDLGLTEDNFIGIDSFLIPA